MMHKFQEKPGTENEGRFYDRAERNSNISLVNRWTNRDFELFRLQTRLLKL